MTVEASLKIFLADQHSDFLMDCGNASCVELGTFGKEWFEYILVIISLFLVRYFLSFVLYLLTIFYTINDILIFQEKLQPFYDDGYFGLMTGKSLSISRQISSLIIVKSFVPYWHRHIYTYIYPLCGFIFYYNFTFL